MPASDTCQQESLLLLLPNDIVAEILRHFPALSEQRLVLHTCSWTRSVWTSLSESIHFNQSLRLSHYVSVVSHMTNVRTLDLSMHANDAILTAMQSHMPLLETLRVIGSSDVTNEGISTLGANVNRQQHLRLLDITLCNNVHYGATLSLRRLLHPDLVIRRQPAWKDGTILYVTTPNDLDLGGVHTCTFWADGSFSFHHRATLNCGIVSRQDHGGFILCMSSWSWRNADQLGNVLQYCDDGAKTDYYSRPGICLAKVPPETSDSESREPPPTGSDINGNTIVILTMRTRIGPPLVSPWWPIRERRDINGNTIVRFIRRISPPIVSSWWPIRKGGPIRPWTKRSVSVISR